MKKIIVKVFHCMRPRFESILEPTDKFREVGSIEIKEESFKSDIVHMDELYVKTQNIIGGWPTHHTVHTNLAQCRSTSVGDIMSVDDKFYVVSDFGFDELLVIPNILVTYYVCPMVPSSKNKNLQEAIFDSLMEDMPDITGLMVKAQEAYVYRNGKLIDRLEYDSRMQQSTTIVEL